MLGGKRVVYFLATLAPTSSTARPRIKIEQLSVHRSHRIKTRPPRTLHSPGGKLCLNFSAFSPSSRTKVYKYLEHLILNLVTTLPWAAAALAFLERMALGAVGVGWRVVFLTLAAVQVKRGGEVRFSESVRDVERTGFEEKRVEPHTLRPFSWRSPRTS